ncbi:MAG: ABC transporter ATP-binding protein [Clostridia bacterium]|nr:ABC transporter ATP-binding protein [Clostridia bacterium]
MSIIKAEGVSIRYITGDFKDIGLKEYVMQRLRGQYHVSEFWADRDISFELERGDMLGIIGTNGAGKSTLLKAVSGIMVPTRGKMKVRGSIAALLELASGFDGDLTVRENTYLRGAMLGYTRRFMDEKYDEIIDFAELREFQDRKFKQLSSGMKSRLAFSIACLVSPDILILDEVLSVGDGAFRKKSGDKMKEILAGGVTGILVSHSIAQVREMCNKILWLDHGKQVAFSDNVKLYCDAYEEFLQTKKLPQSEDDVKALAKGWAKRKRAERVRKERTEKQKLEAILEAGEKDAALKAALAVINKRNPELLTEEAKQKLQ